MREQFGSEALPPPESSERKLRGSAGPGVAFKQLEDYVDEITALKKVYSFTLELTLKILSD